MNSHNADRIVIVGGGVAGLAIAARLSQAGLPVTVLETSRLGVGASTRNQGWLHSGAWFAPAQLELAQMCYASLEQTLRFCPECVAADPQRMVYLISQSETDPGRWTTAWEAAGIPYDELTAEELFERFPGLAISKGRYAFQLPDRAMRTDLLLRRLAEAAQNAGAEIRSGTTVTRLIQRGNSVQGVELGHGDSVAARLVILAGNALGGSLLPDFGTRAVGADADVALLALKTHLVAIRPEISPWPLCVVDADGFNHLPHRPASVFGTSRWLPVGHALDEQVIPSEIERIWHHMGRIFPDLQREGREITEWAGTTVQAMHLEQVEAGQVPLPMVIDYQQESGTVENLLSVFPGRATLWAQLAEMALARVLANLGDRQPEVALPPWSVPQTR